MVAFARLRSDLARCLMAAVLGTSIALVLRSFSTLEPLDLSLYDWLVRARASAFVVDEKPPIVMIKVKQGRQGQSLTDQELAQALEALAALKPRVVGIDILRDQAAAAENGAHQPMNQGRERLEKILSAHPEMVGPLVFSQSATGGRVLPPDPLLISQRYGFIDTTLDPSSSAARRGMLRLEEEIHANSFDLELARRYLGLQDFSIVDGLQDGPLGLLCVKFGAGVIPLLDRNSGGYIGAEVSGAQYLLDYRENRGFDSVPLEMLLQRTGDARAVRDRIAIIGYADRTEDSFRTPLTPGKGKDDWMPGIELHAHAISQLLRTYEGNSAGIYGVPGWFTMVVTFSSALIVSLFVVRCHHVRSHIRSSVAFLAVLVLIWCAALLAGWWFAVAAPVIACICSAAVVASTPVRRRIFLSYAREDGTRVREIYDRLRAMGYDPWMDRSQLVPGELWELTIRKEIHNADVFLACLSDKAVAKEGILRKEMQEALDTWNERLAAGFCIIPVRIEECKVPRELAHLQWVDLFSDNGWANLRSALRARSTTRKDD